MLPKPHKSQQISLGETVILNFSTPRFRAVVMKLFLSLYVDGAFARKQLTLGTEKASPTPATVSSGAGGSCSWTALKEPSRKHFSGEDSFSAMVTLQGKYPWDNKLSHLLSVQGTFPPGTRVRFHMPIYVQPSMYITNCSNKIKKDAPCFKSSKKLPTVSTALS